MRTLKELYTVVYENFRTNLGISYCIFYCWGYSYITIEERNYLREDFKSRRPNEEQYTQFWDKTRDNCTYWWKFNDPKRKAFLKHLIETL